MNKRTLSDLVTITVEDYVKELSLLKHSDEKIDKMIEYIKIQLTHGEIQPLSRFWGMRKFCLDQFKEPIPINKKLKLWEDYCLAFEDILKLKQNLDQKMSQEKELIETSVTMIEQELAQIGSLIEKEESVELPKCLQTAENEQFYNQHQKQLNVYTTYAKRLNALKNEFLDLNLSFKQKEDALAKIHSLADQVFPKKRDLLNQISKKYIEDIRSFIKTHFNSSHSNKVPAFNLKDQIKNLQSFAKVISLNVDAFSKTRQWLSECWDKVKEYEKQQKKIKEEKKLALDEKHEDLQKKLDGLKSEKNQIKQDVYNDQIKELSVSIKKSEILKSQKKKLKEQLDLLDENSVAQEDSSAEKELLLVILREAEQIKENFQDWDYLTIEAQVKQVFARYDLCKLLDNQQLKAEKALCMLKEILVQSLIAEIQDQTHIEELSFQIESVRIDLKDSIEKYRRILNSSNQSIEKAIVYNELSMQTKALLSSLDKHMLATQRKS